MPAQPNLDFRAHIPTHREITKARLAERRNPMYAWRSNADQTVFDIVTGARCARRQVYNPCPTQRDRGTATSHHYKHANGSQDPETRRLGSRAGARSHSGRQAGEVKGEGAAQTTVWGSVANSTGDRRRWWKQTNFTFSPNHFHSSGGTSIKDTSYNGSPACDVYTPYIHDTILLCTPMQHTGAPGATNVAGDASRRPHRGGAVALAVTWNGAEAQARELQAAEDAKKGEMLSLSSLSPVPYVQLQTTAHAHASVLLRGGDEGRNHARAAAPGTLHNAITSAPYTTVGCTAPPHVAGSLDEEINTPGDTKHKPANEAHTRDSDPTHLSKATWCDVLGPIMASKQRMSAMAEGIYMDLIAGEAQRTGTAYGSAASLRMATVPTCELAYSLRASYMCDSHEGHGRSGRHENGNGGGSGGHPPPRGATYGRGSELIKRSRASPNGTSHSAGEKMLQNHQPSSSHDPSPKPQRPASATIALSNSVAQGSALSGSTPYRRSITEIGVTGLVGASASEERVEEGGAAAPQPGSTREFPVVAVPPAATAAGESARTTQLNPLPPLPAQPSAQHQQPVKATSADHSLTNSPKAASRTMSTDLLPNADSGGILPATIGPTAPPTLSPHALERKMGHETNSCNSTVAQGVTQKVSPLAVVGHRSNRRITSPINTGTGNESQHTYSADSPLAMQTVAGDSLGNTIGRTAQPPQRQGRPPSGPQSTRRERSVLGGSGRRSRWSDRPSRDDDAARQENRRLPAEAKETRVYTVRMRPGLTKASVPTLKWRESPWSGVPVLLPQDWQ
ncbi:hypothetical protein ABL78_4802 [Leptomonas seymouri]|uniref:Uncharacterized protein n=1 Tax=Leptomonas seymouri TaxID=5684 RepID=A0A0N0P5M1_LEPSE|nr:hypothetical protein ABL78_4802 [Leptomonas seymouri]|eukprot:KPI86147.1 hypothetical protein ABL78_4802 [Leptomonas seymouri]